MRPDVYLEMAAAQERHWWFATRQLDDGANLARARLLLTGIFGLERHVLRNGLFLFGTSVMAVLSITR